MSSVLEINVAPVHKFSKLSCWQYWRYNIKSYKCGIGSIAIMFILNFMKNLQSIKVLLNGRIH
jgi:hypothetical protein